MSKFTDVEKVVGHTCHKLTCFVVVVEGIGQFFKMAEKVTAHLGLHLHTHDVAVVVDIVVHSGAEEIDRKKHCGHYEDFLYHPVWDVDVKDLGCHHWVQKSHH